MSALKRIALLLLLSVAVIATFPPDVVLRHWLAGRIANPHLVDALSWAIRFTVWSLPFLLCRACRDLGRLRPAWTWTVWLVFPYLLLNAVFFRGMPEGKNWLAEMWIALAVASWEELIFRGYALSRGEAHPRLAICLSAGFFAFLHPNFPVANILMVFSVGIGFGIVRVVSGSLSPCILIHALTNWLSVGSNPPDWAITLVALGATVATLAVLWRHPKLQSRVRSVDSRTGELPVAVTARSDENPK